MNILIKPNPEPLLISDNLTKTLSIYGGVVANYSNQILKNKHSFTTDILESISDFIENLSPLIYDAYRADLSSYQSKSKIFTSFYPLRKQLRTHPSSTADWKIDKDLRNNFRTLQAMVLQNYIDGRHSSFGILPEKKQLLFLHILDSDARKVPEFLGILQLKLINLLARKGKIHYFNQQERMLITTLIEEIEMKEVKDDSYIYF